MAAEFLMVLNPQREVVYANQSVLTAAGASTVEEVVGRRAGELLGCAHALDHPGTCGTSMGCEGCGIFQSLVESRTGRSPVKEFRIVVRHGTREETLELRAWANSVEFNGLPATFLAAVDVADERNRELLDRVFLHDIMNTATALRGLSTLLQTDDSSTATHQDFVLRISSLSGQIVDQINSHREIIAAEHGELRVTRQNMSSRQLLHDIFTTYHRSDTLDQRVLLVVDTGDDVTFESDPTLLSRVVGNMTKNAIEAAAPGDTVTVWCRATDKTVQFCVHNPGYIPENVRQEIFKRSFSTRGPGRGLGTYSMKVLTERYLGGQVSFTSTLEDGTTFTAACPL